MVIPRHVEIHLCQLVSHEPCSRPVEVERLFVSLLEQESEQGHVEVQIHSLMCYAALKRVGLQTIIFPSLNFGFPCIQGHIIYRALQLR